MYLLYSFRPTSRWLAGIISHLYAGKIVPFTYSRKCSPTFSVRGDSSMVVIVERDREILSILEEFAEAQDFSVDITLIYSGPSLIQNRPYQTATEEINYRKVGITTLPNGSVIKFHHYADLWQAVKVTARDNPSSFTQNFRENTEAMGQFVLRQPTERGSTIWSILKTLPPGELGLVNRIQRLDSIGLSLVKDSIESAQRNTVHYICLSADRYTVGRTSITHLRTPTLTRECADYLLNSSRIEELILVESPIARGRRYIIKSRTNLLLAYPALAALDPSPFSDQELQITGDPDTIGLSIIEALQ